MDEFVSAILVNPGGRGLYTGSEYLSRESLVVLNVPSALLILESLNWFET